DLMRGVTAVMRATLRASKQFLLRVRLHHGPLSYIREIRFLPNPIAFWTWVMDWADRIGRRVKLRDLHVLLAVAQWGSMAGAARHLSTSQPVISKTIAELKHALGVKLLDRNPQGIVPTMYGRALMSRGIAIFDELREGIKELEFLADPAAGELRIG